jgi:hypothetical protein
MANAHARRHAAVRLFQNMASIARRRQKLPSDFDPTAGRATAAVITERADFLWVNFRDATGGGVEHAFEMAGSVKAMELAYRITLPPVSTGKFCRVCRCCRRPGPAPSKLMRRTIGLTAGSGRRARVGTRTSCPTVQGGAVSRCSSAGSFFLSPPSSAEHEEHARNYEPRRTFAARYPMP